MYSAIKVNGKKLYEYARKGEQVKIPTYNFSTGKKEYHNEMQLEEKDILIIEGIHALDNKILTNIDRSKKFKIYILVLLLSCIACSMNQIFLKKKIH